MKRIIARNRFSSYPDVYGRMAWDKAAPTIKRECSHVGNERYVHPEEVLMDTFSLYIPVLYSSPKPRRGSGATLTFSFSLHRSPKGTSL